MGRYRSYIICTSPRSGSTLLCRLLAATGRSGNPDSHFHRPSLAAWCEDYDIASDRLPSRRDLLGAVFEAAIARGTGNTELFGLRLQRHSFDFFMQQLEILHPGRASDFERMQAAFGETLFIHLTRENKLEQAISLVKATQTGLWHKAPDGTELERLSAPQDPFYDAQAITRNLSDLTSLDDQWKAWFVKEELEPLRITYDALSAGPTDVLAQILDRLQVGREYARTIDPPVAKLADETSRNWAERFQSQGRNGID